MNLVDLFAGCGGFSTGFEMVGFKTLLAIERDQSAASTYAVNHKETRVLQEDITKVQSLEGYINIEDIDGIIGSPPCQGFSLSGNRDPKDPRNSLFMDYLRFVSEIRPKFFVLENVTGMLSMKTIAGIKVMQIIQEEVYDLGYKLVYRILNAAEYGVPQARKRLILIGVRNDLEINPEELFPEPMLDENDYITVDEAISDLPDIKAGEGEEQQEYRVSPLNKYQEWVRGNNDVVYNHIAMKHTKRLQERFSHIGYGQSVADVSEEFGQRKRGNSEKLSGKSYKQNNYRPYPNKPAPTIAASFQSNFVHPYLNRNFTAREGARLQSFPDWYIFTGNRTNMSWDKSLSQYQQIGNAVPPLLAKAIAEQIKEVFENLGILKKESERKVGV